ncbi:asparaginase [Hylemonella gracilis]|uniref:Asparaginase n=1 Tax=Hylemonella gracilis ATCC 19624 TaxID=887062 RepID=F3KUU9_9BURK|nr:asparaginase [Hylemonella gracilis]EGI76442.1 asparaginase [Hylemonella gracilis ATCC 19624]
MAHSMQMQTQPPVALNVPLCQLIATGGTIAMKIDPVRGGPVPALSGADLLAAVPAMAQVARLEVRELFNIPSDHVDATHWLRLKHAVDEALARPEVTGVIVSHGTDTMEETAWFLDLAIDSDKPVVLTGAQRNASVPDFDGPRNLLNAARVCVERSAQGMGVMVAMNNQIHAAREVSKTHTSDVEAFKSGDFGLLGVIDEDRVVFSRRPTRRLHLPPQSGALPRVEIIPMFAGARGDLLCAAVALGARGIVVQALGLGNVNVDLLAAVKEAIAQGVVVAVATRVPNGRVQPVYGFEGGGRTLQAEGAVFTDNLSPHKARILLMLALQSATTPSQLQSLFDR